MHVAKELADELKNQNIECVKTQSSMALRLRFYGVNNCDSYILTENELSDADKTNSVTISYRNIPIYKAYVTKINK
jgi:hypothetical protein